MVRRVTAAGAALLFLDLALPAYAEVPSVIGGKLLPAGASTHHFGVGLPSTFWEWWNGGGEMNWAVHVGLVYEDWSGEFSDVDVGLDLEAPMRFHLARQGRVDTALRFAPGLLLGSHDHGRRREDDALIGLRPEIGVLVGIELGRAVNLATGGVVPFSIFFHDHGTGDDVYFVIPLMPRVGVEVLPLDSLAFWGLLEIGPTIGIGGGDSDVDAGMRFWIGVSWHP